MLARAGTRGAGSRGLGSRGLGSAGLSGTTSAGLDGESDSEDDSEAEETAAETEASGIEFIQREGVTKTTWRAILKRLIDEEFSAIRVPRELCINNSRLGLLQKVLQVLAAIATVSYFLALRIWIRHVEPLHHGNALSSEPPLREAASEHCQRPQDFAVRVSRETSAIPTRCQELSEREAWQVQGTSLFLPLQVYDEFSLHFNRSDLCTDAAQATCRSGGGVWQSRTGHGAGEYLCECGRTDTFLVRNVAERRVCFSHPVIRREPYILGPGDPEALRVRTLFRKVNGAPFRLGGRSQYDSFPGRPFCGSLREWLAAGDQSIDLESDPKESLRSRGFVLELHFKYHDIQAGMAICYASVTVHPSRMSTTQVDHAELSMVPGERTGKHMRKAIGVLVHASVEASLPRFDLRQLITGVVDSAFLTEVPAWLVTLVLLYGLGVPSVVYRQAKITQFHTFRQLRTTVAKLLSPSMVHLSLRDAQDWEPPVPEMLEPEETEVQSEPTSKSGTTMGRTATSRTTMTATASAVEGRHLSKWRVYRQLLLLFKLELTKGELKRRHVVRLTAMLFQGCERKMSIDSFTAIMTDNEVINMHDLAIMIRFSRSKSALETYFADLSKQFSQVTGELGDGDLAGVDQSDGRSRASSKMSTVEAADDTVKVEEKKEAVPKKKSQPQLLVPKAVMAPLEAQLDHLEKEAQGLDESCTASVERAHKVGELVSACVLRSERAMARSRAIMESSRVAEEATQGACDAVRSAIWSGAALDNTVQGLLQSYKDRGLGVVYSRH